ncbi:MAG: TonB-dependent receptor, partial [Alphaproteobacteria bacterium]|nr:TonB-dependent receptor [Alphaproteobacteria bacterium]
ATDSLYGQAILNPAARLTLTGGLRYDHARSFGGHVTAAANGAWVLGTDTTLRASFAQGFKAPTLYQLYAPFYGTATLRPETANSFDGGIEHIISNNIHLRATYFYRTTHNLIDFDPASFTYSNIARARAHGLELEANGQVARGLILAANYTHSASINPDTGKDLARRPRDVANLSLDWVAARAQGLKFGGTLSYNGPRFDDAANLVPLGSYWLLGARASFPLNAHLELYGRIENALDEQYQVVKHYGTLGRAAYAGVRVKL